MTELHPAFDIRKSPHQEVDEPIEELGARLKRNKDVLGAAIIAIHEDIEQLKAEIPFAHQQEIEDLHTYLVSLETKLDAFGAEFASLTDRLDLIYQFLEHNRNPKMAEA